MTRSTIRTRSQITNILPAALCLVMFTCLGHAQVSHCGGLTSITEWKPPVYPPIAKAAHIEGSVIFLLTFDTAGGVTDLQILSGNKYLIGAATISVKPLRVNTYTGPRTCPFIITFRIAKEGEDNNRLPRPADIQHMTVTADSIVLSDPMYTVVGRERRGIF